MTKTFTSATFSIKSIIILSFLIFSFQDHIHAQSLKFKVKLEENFTQTFETLKQSHSSAGYIEYGVPELDSLNKEFNVIRMERLFKYSPRFEKRHREAGLHRWYELVVDRNASASTEEFCIQSYKECDLISTAEPFLEKVYNDNYNPEIEYETIRNEGSFLVDSNDPMLDQQWHYENTGQSGGTAGADINLKNAWTIEAGDSSVVVAIIDGGVDIDHQDLAPNMWRNTAEINGVDGVDDDGNGYIDDFYGYNFGDDIGAINDSEHGTHVAGTVGAVNNNGVGVSGVAGGSGSGDGIRMMSCAVFGDFGNDGFDEAFIYAADNGAVIAQNSWGYTSPGFFEQSVLDAIDYFIANAGRDENGAAVGPLDGGIVIFAAGNDNSSADHYPGFYEPVLSVASTDHNDLKSSFSNYGAWVDIAAPGSNVLSTFPNDNYSTISGTSMACPHVSGVAALIVSQYSDLTNDGLRNILTSTTDTIDYLNSGYINQLGSGRLNAFTALQSNDSIPPSTIEDLIFVEAEPTSITINWTAPGGSDTAGVASKYDIRYSTSIIDSANFDLADSVTNLPNPLPYGESQTFTINDLNPLTTYYVAIKSKDFFGETSTISNVLTASTTDVPVFRIEPDNLYADMLSGDSITQTLTIFNDGNYPLSFEVSNANYEVLNITEVNLGSVPHQSLQTKNYVSLRAGLLNLSDSIDGNIIFEDDFEGDVSDWTIEVYSGSDLWHITDENSSSPANSWSCSREDSSNYNTGNRINTAVISPKILLNSISQDSIFLTFRESYSTEGGWDYCMVDITTDNGNNWQPLRGTASDNSAPSGSSNGWITSRYDLSNFSGESIKLRFYFDTKDGQEQNYPGWFFDDVVVYGGKPKWQSVSLQSAVVEAGESIELDVIFNAKDLPSGNYKDSLVFITNDPSNEIVNVATEIDVTGAPGIELSTNELHYDSLFINDTLKKTVQIRSVGTDTLFISDITLESENYKIDSSLMALPAGSEYDLEISFLPESLGALADTLKIFSNDSITPILSVSLMGYGVEPPVMTVSPDSIHVDLMTNDSTIQYLTIDNTTGGSNLYVNLDSTFGNSEINGTGTSGFDWLKLDFLNDTIPAGTSKNIALDFNSTELLGGRYNAEINISSNDPLTPFKKIPIVMDVTGIPEISISKDTLSFGNVFVGQAVERSLTIENVGSDLLEISSISSSSSDYTIDSTNFNLTPGQSIMLGITYAPTVVGLNNIDLEIESNDTSNSIGIVKLLGESINPPVINIDPDSLSVALNSGDSTVESFMIDNSLGGSVLDWQIDIINVNAQANHFLDFNQNLNQGQNNNGETVPNRIRDKMPLVAGDFTALNNSPGNLTAVSINSDRTIIYALQNNSTSFFQYSIENETWSTLPECPINSGNNGGAVALNGKIYHAFTESNEFAIYDISTASWTRIPSQLATGNITTDGEYIYLANGLTLFQFDPNTSQFLELTSPNIHFNSWGGLEYYDGYLYGHVGNGETQFSRYNISSDSWEILANVPGGAILASAVDPLNGNYYTYGSYSGNNWYQYDIVELNRFLLETVK